MINFYYLVVLHLMECLWLLRVTAGKFFVITLVPDVSCNIRTQGVSMGHVSKHCDVTLHLKYMC